jgi:hypothetical protein
MSVFFVFFGRFFSGVFFPRERAEAEDEEESLEKQQKTHHPLQA